MIKWRIKEEWFFDKQRSVMDVRILGLAPMIENTMTTGDKLEHILHFLGLFSRS